MLSSFAPFYVILNQSLSQYSVPILWKTSYIIPVPKKTTVKVMNDLRPVALTYAMMKVFERIVLSQLQSLVADFLDPLQFEYRRGRGVEDAVLHNIHSHLDKACSYIRLTFFDFSNVFNTIQLHLLAEKLLKMKVSIPTGCSII